MAKRKSLQTAPESDGTPRKRSRRSGRGISGGTDGQESYNSEGVDVTEQGDIQISESDQGDNASESPSKPPKAQAARGEDTPVSKFNVYNGDIHITPTPGRRKLFQTPSKTAQADRSAKRKIASALLEQDEDNNWNGQERLAREILGDEDAEGADEDAVDGIGETMDIEDDNTTPAATPSRRGRPKGSKNKRSPTPEGDIPPEERYFFQNRHGPLQISSNTLSSLKLLSHDEYFEHLRATKDHHDLEKRYLMKMHRRAFPQWKVELSEGFGICLYGYGSKRHLVQQFAEWISLSIPQPQIVIVNGYTARLTLKLILTTIASAVSGSDGELKLTGSSTDMLDTLLSHLSKLDQKSNVYVLINSIDAPALKRSSVQAVLARMAAHPRLRLLATADTPTCALQWNSTLLDQFGFVFHDATTFAPYEAEISVVDEVHELLGRKGRRIGGKDGIGFVLKSLPENARNLYRVLLSEILSILNDGMEGFDAGDGEEDEETTMAKRPGQNTAEDVGVEYRSLYQKASEEFICSSDMNFRFLLKEFHDHQMITSQRDSNGTETLGVPLSKDEMLAVLEDLVVG